MEMSLYYKTLFPSFTKAMNKSDTNNLKCHWAWNGLSSVCTKLELADSNSIKIVKTNVVQNFDLSCSFQLNEVENFVRD